MNKNKIIIAIAVSLVAIVILLKIFTGEMSESHIKRGEGMDISSWQTRQGAKVMYVAAPELPMVDVRVIFDAGSARDAGSPGLARLTNEMLNQGAQGMTVDAIAEAFEDIGAQYSSGTDRDKATVHLRSLSEEEIFEQALQTFVTVISKPVFNEDSFKREQQLALTSIQAQHQSPSALASMAFYENLYPGHPYATPVLGTADSVAKIKAADLAAFHKQYYVANNAVIVIVGKVAKAKAEKIANRIASALPKGEKASAIPEVPARTAAQTIHTEYASTQTSVYIGQPGVKRGDKDHFALYVGNHILGGSGFSARIFAEIREKRGLAYSAYSYFTPMRVKGPFMIGLQTRNDQTDEAIRIANETVNKFVTEGPTAAELEHAKKNITGGFALRVDSNKDITEYIAVIGFYDLPLNYLTTFNANVNAVTLQQIKDAFNRHLATDKFLTITVGKKLSTDSNPESKSNPESSSDVSPDKSADKK